MLRDRFIRCSYAAGAQSSSTLEPVVALLLCPARFATTFAEASFASVKGQIMRALTIFIALAMLAPPSIVFGQMTGQTSQPIPNPYEDAASRAASLLNESLAHIDGSYRGVHQCFGDDLVCRTLESARSRLPKTVATVARDYICPVFDQGKLSPSFDVVLDGSMGPVELKDGSLREFCARHP